MAQYNRVYIRTATAGTGTATLGAVVSTQFCTFAQAGAVDGDEIRSYIFEEGLDFEIGVGIYNSAGPTLTRATVRLSLIAGVAGTTKMTLAGNATVRCIAAKEDVITKDTSGNVAIGANLAADSLLTINSNTVSPSAPASQNYLHIVGADATAVGVAVDGISVSARFDGRRADGTLAAKTAVVSTNTLLNMIGMGWDTAAYQNGGAIQITAAETFSPTARGCYVDIFSTPLTTTTLTRAIRVQPSGGLSIGAAAIASDPGAGNLNVSGSVGFGPFTVATLPAGVTGKQVWCSDCRVFNGAGVQEGAGVGTGGMVSYNSTAWKIVGTNVTAVA